MFSTHQPIIGQWARETPDNLRDVYRFVLLTIRYPLLFAAQDMREDNPKALTGTRRVAWDHADACKREIYEGALDAWDRGGGAAELTAFFAALPGLGLVKAGFVAQLAFGVSGCLDSHNLERFGLSVWTFAHYKRRQERGRARMVERYVTEVEKRGGTAGLWDDWCAYVAERDSKYKDAAHVSECHPWAFHLV